MQLQLVHKAVQSILLLGGRAIKDILADVRVDEDSKSVGELVAAPAFDPLAAPKFIGTEE